MPLTNAQQTVLQAAVDGYDYPTAAGDFALDQPVPCAGMAALEAYIAPQLRSAAATAVIDGLSNVLYWGFARVGFRDHRVQDFRSRVTADQISAFQAIVTSGATPGPVAIANLRMPQFGSMSFVSKVVMFLDPRNRCTLDRLVAQLGAAGGSPAKALDSLAVGTDATAIRVSAHNQAVYLAWCRECSTIAATYYPATDYRCADVERGFFSLVDKGRLAEAAAIYHAA